MAERVIRSPAARKMCSKSLLPRCFPTLHCGDDWSTRDAAWRTSMTLAQTLRDAPKPPAPRPVRFQKSSVQVCVSVALGGGRVARTKLLEAVFPRKPQNLAGRIGEFSGPKCDGVGNRLGKGGY
ncbi:hypothetical protein HC256_010449 [Beauveria bassiana]|nr:hypothetical protein HC256_010449 [Beauveria bassiana]